MAGRGVSRGGIWPLVIVVVLVFLTSPAVAQDSTDALIGYWRQNGEAVFMEISQTESGFEGVIVRADWTPGLVGSKVYPMLAYNDDRKRWIGRMLVPESQQVEDVELTLKRNNKELWSKTLSGPRTRVKWKRATPEEVN
ncbi:hypothetical protein [Arenicella xantha]|uniref:DUF2147 domain-containing protein n=1 Tax=Arenicella xantha TaxID=644221 RepID=A0A395JEM2_9GAMM|nr:hypothetical protein [Arenicella xantha]RBP47053.1 hypothetical protein DFR28_11016 [Arenicella xantha]